MVALWWYVCYLLNSAEWFPDSWRLLIRSKGIADTNIYKIQTGCVYKSSRTALNCHWVLSYTGSTTFRTGGKCQNSLVQPFMNKLKYGEEIEDFSKWNLFRSKAFPKLPYLMTRGQWTLSSGELLTSLSFSVSICCGCDTNRWADGASDP